MELQANQTWLDKQVQRIKLLASKMSSRMKGWASQDFLKTKNNKSNDF